MEDGAWRWFDVRGEFTRSGPVSMLLAWGKRNHRQSCAVFLCRRDNAETVLRYDFTNLSEATQHLTRLRARLAELRAEDFCREVGIAPEWVIGPGTAERLAPEASWTSVDRIPPTPW